MSNLKIDQEEFNRKAQHILDTIVRPQVERYEKAKAEQQKNKMTAVEKANQLIDKYRTYLRIADKYEYLDPEDELHLAKQCALTLVDEILELICCMDGKEHWQEYYEQVKHELNKSE